MKYNYGSNLWKSTCWLLLILLIFGLLLTRPQVASQAARVKENPEANSLRQVNKLWEPQLRYAQSEENSVPELIDRAFRNGEITAEQRLLYLAYAVYDSQKLPLRFQSNVPWWGTEVVRELRQAQSNPLAHELSTQVQAEINQLLSLQAATVCDQQDGANNIDSAHFHVNYGTITGLTINDYTTALETTFGTEVTSYGWGNPPLCTAAKCTNDNPWDRYPVQVAGLGNSLYGYVTYPGGIYTGVIGDNPNTTPIETTAVASCMVLNSNYTSFPGGAWFAMSVTAAHEFVHSIQYGVGDQVDLEDDIWYESIAAYMEDEVYDSSNDNYQYLYPNLTSCLGQFSGDVYSYWIFFRYAAEHNGGTNVAGGGEDIAQKFWEYVSSQSQTGLAAYNNALATKGANLPNTFHNFAIATRFMQSCPTSAPYCYEEAAGYVSAAGSVSNNGSIASPTGTYNGSIQDNYSINYIGLPTSGTFDITLQNLAAGGQLRGSIVALTGSGLTVTSFPAVVNASGSTVLPAYTPPAGTTQLVAVITNQSQTADNPSSCTSRSYRISLSAAAPDTTPPAAVTNLAASSGALQGSVDLSWTAPGDDGSTGTASAYIVRYNTVQINEANWASSTDVTGEPTPAVAGTAQTMMVSGLTPGQLYYFALKTQDEVPNTSAISNSPPASANSTPPKLVYLPVVLFGSNTLPAINGRVLLAGVALPGVEVELYNDSGLVGSDVTDSNGRYEFPDAPTLAAGDAYYVEYFNDEDVSGRLWFWDTPDLTTYTAGSAYEFADFDIADIALVSPADGALVTLPQIFEWTPRSATPTDSYEFDVYDPVDYDPWGYTSPLGYVGSVSISSLPEGFLTYTSYIWDIWVYAPDGGMGESYDYRYVMFTNTGLRSQLLDPFYWLREKLYDHLPRIRR